MEDSATESGPKRIPGSTFVVPIEHFREAAVVAAIATTSVVDNHDVDQRLKSAISAAKGAGQQYAQDALAVLASISSYHFVPDDRAQPFQPMIVVEGGRSAVPTDLQPDQVEVLRQLAPDIGHPALRARVADVCRHLDKRDAASGLLAVDSYLACVTAVLLGEAQFDFGETDPASPAACEFLRRASIIARSMGWQRSEFDCLREVISEISNHALTSGDVWRFSSIADLNLEYGVWDYLKVAKSVENLYNNNRCDVSGLRELCNIAVRVYRLARDSDNANLWSVRAAETYVTESDARTDSAMAQASFLNQAIQALRPIPGTLERRRELQARLNEVQPGILEEMSNFSHEEDITELVKAVEAEVRGNSLSNILRTCFTCSISPDPDSLRTEVLKNAYGSIAAMFSTTVSDSQGRTRFVAPGLAPDGPPDEGQVKFLINQSETIRRSLVVVGRINPIRRILVNEHVLSLDSILPLMEQSPFVQPGHEYIFAQGLMRFLSGYDIEAAHLILPQLENSIRHILRLAGVETNRLNQDGTQEEAMLSRLLGEYKDPLLEIIPNSLFQEIDILFNFAGGPSVRHEMAHGKMDDNQFWHSDVIYSVWLVLHIAILPLLRFWDDVESKIQARARS